MNVKGYEFPNFVPRGVSSRRAVQFQNNILNSLAELGLTEDDVECEVERIAIRRVPASVTWYLDDEKLFYSYNGGNYIENLYVVSKVIQAEVAEVVSGRKSREQHVLDFMEDDDIDAKRKEAREVLEVPEDCRDLELINKHYKRMARDHHPDMGGNIEMFKKINSAHKMLLRELR
ncbi:TPA: J domain-containing protein [Candidatus Woesearchaeota archaeon]|nr:J domain-containing protein [Candidatus Woesearchaeota archaeon]